MYYTGVLSRFYIYSNRNPTEDGVVVVAAFLLISAFAYVAIMQFRWTRMIFLFSISALLVYLLASVHFLGT